jgi:hypothetical protein
MDALLADLERARRAVPLRALVVAAATAGVVAAIGWQLDALRAAWHPVTIALDVEHARIVEPMQLYRTAEGDSYAAATTANRGRVELDFDLPTGGRYYVHGLLWEEQLGGDRGDADSFLVYVDGGEEKLWHFGCQNQRFPDRVLVDHWAWQPALHMQNADSDCELSPPLWWALSAGPHTLVVRNREDAATPASAARLARLVVTNQSRWQP